MILRIKIRRDSLFVGLKVTRQVAAHLVNLERSVFEQIAAARGLSTTMKMTSIVCKKANILAYCIIIKQY